MTLEEWQARKMESVQKGVLLIRSAFEHCVQKELSDAGFDKTRILIGSVIALVTVVITLGIVYFAMKTANAMGAMSAMLSSGVSAVAIGICEPLRFIRCMLTWSCCSEHAKETEG